eukprot:5444302-Prymnesium_polylepis.3
MGVASIVLIGTRGALGRPDGRRLSQATSLACESSCFWLVLANFTQVATSPTTGALKGSFRADTVHTCPRIARA